MRLKLKRTPGIYLVGFMACGKSTVGRALADHVGWKFADLDHEIEAAENTTVPQIFDERGEPAFRELESEALKKFVRQIQGGRPHVLSLGGGTFLSPQNITLLANNGVSLWLDCPLDRIERRLEGSSHRPLARDNAKMRELYEARREAYSQADYRVDIQTDDPDTVVQQILNLPLL